MNLTAYHAKYYAYELIRRHAVDDVGRLSHSLFDASVDLNPHQIEAALFALHNPLQEGVLLADEVGLGKTIEAALVLCQYWAERRRRLLVICPASLRKQWAQEIEQKFSVPTVVLDRTRIRKQAGGEALTALRQLAGWQVVIVSYSLAVKLETELRAVLWDVVVIDEAHKLRNAHRESNRTGQALKRALAGRKKLLLTATPLQNSLLELYGLSYVFDEYLFGDAKAFRKQYMHADADLEELRERLADFVHRTLRKDVLEYIQYTERKTITQPFEPTDEEQALYDNISTFLQKPDSYALPIRHRHLIGLILRKLLASSPNAIVGTLSTIRDRLQKRLHSTQDKMDALIEQLTVEDDLEQDYLEEEFAPEDTTNEEATKQNNAERLSRGIRAEIAQINGFIQQAEALQTDSKAEALLHAVEAGFARMAELGAKRKAVVFTESRRTQEYLYEFLTENGYGGKLALFSGTNTHPSSQAIYRDWLADNEGTEHVTGSKPVDQRTALIDHFRADNGADILIATEAAAEGVNLQFCSLVINYDLPWNPQRVEQRIGRCHRYGQKHDVVVINFLNERNEADRRVLELLTEKFNLFDGVFGASDEILGKVESGIDFEKRILNIYDTCRSPQEIETAFNELQGELEEEIAERIHKTQSQLLENFDQDVHDRLKLRLDEAQARLDQIGRWFWGVTRYALGQRARFDDNLHAFSLLEPPAHTDNAIDKGRYQLVRGAAQADALAHAYRLNHPLGEWCIDQALDADTPQAMLSLDYSQLNARISVVEQLRGQSGWLTLTHLQVTAFDTSEALLFSGLTDAGQPLDQDTCEKLLAVPASGKPHANTGSIPNSLLVNSKQLVDATVARILDDNQQLFNAERDKLERWADDKLLAAEQALRQTKERIKQLKRDARQAATLQEQEPIQQQIRELERQKRRQRQAIFDVEDDIIDQRDELIASLQQRLQQDSTTQTLFTIRWRLS